MDFHKLSRRELQVLCKKNKIAANMTNVAMADALAALQHVEGLEEFLNPSEPTDAMQSPEKAPPESPAVPRTTTRASARAKPTKDPDSSWAMSRARRSAMSSRHVADQENKQVNLSDTPAVPITGKRAGLASARRRQEALKRDEQTEEENRDVPKSSTVKSTQRKARVSAAPRVHSTRRSVRLLEKSMSELKLSEERASEVEPIKMDDLGLKEESEEVLEEIEENKNTLDADSQAAEEESSEKPDHSNIHVEKSTGMEEKEERELESHVNVESCCVGDLGSQAAEEESSEKPDHSNVPVEESTGMEEKEERELESDANVESSCIGDLDSKELLEDECGKSDCLNALSDAEEESSEKPDHSNIHVEKSTGMEEKERELERHVNVNVESSCVGDLGSQAAEEESSEKPDHSNVPVEESTGMEEKERELESDVDVTGESSCIGDLGSKVLLEVESGKSDCLSALSDSDLKDAVLDEKSDQLDDNLLVSKLNHDAPPVDTSDLKDYVLDEKSDQLDDNLLVSKLNQDALPVDTSAQTDGHNAFTEIEDHHVEETTNLEISEELAFGEDNQSDDIDIDVKPKTEEKLLNENILEFEEDGNNEGTVENGLTNSLLPEEQMVENNEGVGIFETIICTSDDSDQLVPHIITNPDRLVPHCDDIQEPVGDNDSGVEISMSSQLGIWDSAPVEQEESIKLDQLMSPCLVSQIIQTDKHEDEQLVEVDLIESEEFAMEVREWHKSLVGASAAANSSEVNAADIQGYADLQELVDVQVMPEMEFVEGTCELPPSAIADKTPIFVSKISTRSPLAVNGKVTLSPLMADRLPKSPVLAKSSSKKQSTVRNMANKLDNNKENMDSSPSPLAVAADQLLLLELPGQVKSSSKKQPAPRKMTILLGDDKENMQKSGRKAEPNPENAKKKSNEEKSRDEDRVLEALQKKSLRQLKKMFKERSGMPETERKKDATELQQQQLGSARPALRVLSSENQMALGEVEGN